MSFAPFARELQTHHTQTGVEGHVHCHIQPPEQRAIHAEDWTII